MSVAVPNIRVEFYGVARRRMGIGVAEARGATLGEVLGDLHANHAPAAAVCTAAGELQPGFVANLNGRTFATAAETPVTGEDVVLILSTDAGG